MYRQNHEEEAAGNIVFLNICWLSFSFRCQTCEDWIHEGEIFSRTLSQPDKSEAKHLNRLHNICLRGVLLRPSRLHSDQMFM